MSVEKTIAQVKEQIIGYQQVIKDFEFRLAASKKHLALLSTESEDKPEVKKKVKKSWNKKTK